MADLTALGHAAFRLGIDPRDQISKNFRAYELTKSDLAARLGIDNSFRRTDHLRAAVFLCRNVLQPVRERFGSFTPNSVYRSQPLERALKKKSDGWTSKSQHTKGQACDIEVPKITTLKLAEWIQENLTFDQLICECYDSSLGPNSGWIHVSLRPPGAGANRGSVRSYVRDHSQNKFVYVQGLRETTSAVA